MLLHDALADEQSQPTALSCLQLIRIELHALRADLLQLVLR